MSANHDAPKILFRLPSIFFWLVTFPPNKIPFTILHNLQTPLGTHYKTDAYLAYLISNDLLDFITGFTGWDWWSGLTLSII